VDFKWEKTELASMASATTYLTKALKDAGMPDAIKVLDITDRKGLFNLKDDVFPISTSGTSDFIITKKKASRKTHVLDLQRHTFLVIELKKHKSDEYLSDNSNQAFSLLMALDYIQAHHDRLSVVVLTDLKEFIFCWIGKENQEKPIFYWSTENLQDAAMLMSAIAIGEAQKAGIDVVVPRLPANLAGLQIFNRCKLKDPPLPNLAANIALTPISTETSTNVVSSSSAAAAPSSVASRHLMNLRGRQRSRHRDDDDDDFDDRFSMARQVYLSALRHFDTWSDNPRFGRPLSPEAANMYV